MNKIKSGDIFTYKEQSLVNNFYIIVIKVETSIVYYYFSDSTKNKFKLEIKKFKNSIFNNWIKLTNELELFLVKKIYGIERN